MIKNILFCFLIVVSAYSADTKKVVLSAEEQAYINKKQVVKMCVDPDWVPFESINEQNQHVGIAADLIKLVSERTGVKIELVPTKYWVDSVNLSKNKQCDIMSFLNETPERSKWLVFTEPIFFDKNVFITREEHVQIDNPAKLKNESVALPEQTMVEERIKKAYPNLKIVPVRTENEAFGLVSVKKADMTVRSLIMAAYTIKQDGLFNLKIAGEVPDMENRLRIGVSKDEPILRDILNKGVATITDEDREVIINKYVSIKVETPIDNKLIFATVSAFAVLLLVAFLVLLWNYQLKKKVKIETLKRMEGEKIVMEQTKMAAMGEMIGAIAHQWRQPLNVLGLHIQDMHLAYASNDVDNHYVDTFKDETMKIIRHMSSTIDDFRSFFTPNKGKTRFCVEETLANTLKIISVQMKNNFIDVMFEPTKEHYIVGFKNELEQVFLNILSNAKDAILDGKRERAFIKITTYEDEGDVAICFEDSAGGIRSDVLPRVFEPYFTTKEEGKGTGIGLYMSKEIVERHLGGKISVSNGEYGARFVILLPLEK